MKARKTSPKSIRFNIKDFEIAMSKGSFESAQEMVDFLLNEYVSKEKNNLKIKPKPEIVETNTNVEIDQNQEKVENFLALIELIKNEKIPKERDTPNGRKAWEHEKSQKIKILEDKLKKIN